MLWEAGRLRTLWPDRTFADALTVRINHTVSGAEIASLGKILRKCCGYFGHPHPKDGMKRNTF